jgi:dephospho-CoA kinase
VVERFGPAVLAPDGELDRKVLAERVFGSAEELSALEGIVHPLVRALFHSEVERLAAEGNATICYEVPLLFEKGLEDGLRPVVLVAAPERLQIERALRRPGSTREDVLKRLSAQLPLREKQARADWIITNDDTLEELYERADDVVRELVLRTRRQPR